MKNFIAGEWIDKPKKIEVRNPFDNSIIDTVPRADAADVERALGYAARGAKVMARLTAYEKWKILRKAADLMAERNEDLGQTISTARYRRSRICRRKSRDRNGQCFTGLMGGVFIAVVKDSPRPRNN